MSRIEVIAEEARALGIRPWVAVKEIAAREAIRGLADDGRVVLQGGAALHFAYGSPRLSVDVDFVGREVGLALAERGAMLAAAVGSALEAPARWSLGRSGRLWRGKVTLDVDAARRVVLPVEAYEVPAHHPRAMGELGTVEEPVEIIADKIVASASRLASRGAVKTRDLYDLWFARSRLGAEIPSRDLVIAKLADYGEKATGLDLVAAVRAVSVDELRQALEGVLPASEMPSLDPHGILSIAAELFGKYRDVL